MGRYGAVETNLRQIFSELDGERHRQVHIWLCQEALEIWQNFTRDRSISYRESVAGTHQIVDNLLPRDAILCVIESRDFKDVYDRYGEPIAALQDDDLVFPDEVCFAYYAIFNCFCLHVVKKSVDPWLIVNQALSSIEESAWHSTLEKAIQSAIGNQSGL